MMNVKKKKEYGNSQWALVWQKLGENKFAMASFWLVIAVIRNIAEDFQKTHNGVIQLWIVFRSWNPPLCPSSVWESRRPILSGA